MNYKKIVCFDLEHCCWADKPVGEIIEIGIAELDTKSGKIRRSQYYVKPMFDSISEYCHQLTGISEKVVRNQGRPLHEVVSSIERNYGSSNKIYACWGRDVEFLARECEDKEIDSPIVNSINLAMLAGLKFKSNRRLSQVEVMDKFGISFDGDRHSGYDDAYNLARLAPKLIFD